MKLFSRIATAVSLTVVCLPLFGARGSADFTRLVALGDSYGAGVSSVGLNIAHQRFSWPAQLARQVGLNTDCQDDGPRCFQIPYISEPGILPELQLTSLSPLGLSLKPGLGAPLRSGLGRSYNNMSIDGAEVGDLLGVSGDGNEGINGPIVLRNLGSPVDQILSLNPTFIVMWIGGNDLLRGGGIPALATSLANFTRDYNAVLDRLVAGAPSAGIVVGNLPTNALRTFPLFNLIPPVLINPQTNQPVLNPSNGQPIFLVADLGGGRIAPLPAGSRILLPALDLIRTGFGIPAALAPLFPTLPNVGRVLPDELVITPDEAAIFEKLVADYNTAIAAAASSRNIPVADIDGLFKRLESGVPVGPFNLSLAFITGGVISFDGYHLTDMGYALFANEYIKTINREYGTRIPLASIGAILQNNGAFISDLLVSGGPSSEVMQWKISAEAMEQIRAIAAPSQAKRRMRSTSH